MFDLDHFYNTPTNKGMGFMKLVTIYETCS